MTRYFSFFLLLILHPLRTWCQTAQDSWTAPAAPDGSTRLQASSPFTIRWKESLHDWFQAYCEACNITGLDLWVTSFNDDNFVYKLAGNVDITTALSYDWDGNIPTAALSENDYWVFRFTPYGATDPFSEQISSSGFYIEGAPHSSTVINTATAQPSSATSARSSSIVDTSSTVNFNATSSPTKTSIAADPVPAPTSKVWIAGVVLGPLAGIAMIAAIVWFLLGKKRRNKQAQQLHEHEASDGYAGGGYYDAPIPADHDANKKGFHAHSQPQGSQPPSEMAGDSWQRGQDPAEVHGSSPEPAAPAELWHGNYRSS